MDEALGQLRRALELAAQHPAPRPRLLTSWCIATVLHLQGRHAEALREFEHIREVSAAEHFPHGEDLALLGLSSAYRDFDLALLRGREALALGRRFELRKVECET
ncbi:hypothetical protein GCM10011609_65590 [Lentzea pudingi]|uniref:Tetratricopeptide repeat-containing protein n=1 Tax=Lentzea pudingi TaxID=1789439 RepID=A0ABQ2IPG0_9PSEU|nr:hypothetical protein GCM10011609_65590 [Lentzea pudingi]